jgi:hypothetical protein
MGGAHTVFIITQQLLVFGLQGDEEAEEAAAGEKQEEQQQVEGAPDGGAATARAVAEGEQQQQHRQRRGRRRQRQRRGDDDEEEEEDDRAQPLLVAASSSSASTSRGRGWGSGVHRRWAQCQRRLWAGVRARSVRLIKAIQEEPFLFLAKTPDPACINKALLYVRENEQTSRVLVVRGGAEWG